MTDDRSTAVSVTAMEKPTINQETQRTGKLRGRPAGKRALRIIVTLVALAVLSFLGYFLFGYFSFLLAIEPGSPALVQWFPELFVALLVLIALVRLGYRYEWTGFGEDVRQKTETQDIRRAKTLWDWLQLLFIPVMLALGGLLLTQAQDERQRAVEEQRAQDTALQAYLDEMGSLLVDEDLRDAQSDEARSLARARTLTILERLVPAPEVRQAARRSPERGRATPEEKAAIKVPDRRKSILQFLYESELISKENPAVSLRSANLREAELRELNLSGADLSGADLFGVEGEGVDLSGANLRETELSAASFENADLSDANLSSAILGSALCDADLSNADLSSADLRQAPPCITQEQIEQANGDETTLLPAYLQRPESWSEGADEQPN